MSQAKHSKKAVDPEALETTAFEITVPVLLMPEGAMYLHESLGTGEYGGKKFEVERVLPNNSIVMRFEGKKYRVALHDIMQKLLEGATKK
jgi:hypothetical protein